MIILLCRLQAQGQDAILRGVVRDSIGKPIEAVSVSINGEPGGTITDQKGKYELRVSPYRELTIVFSFIGYGTEKISVKLNPGEERNLDIRLRNTSKILGTVNIEAARPGDLTVVRIEPRTIEQLPNVSGNFESFLKTMPGVVSNNELSSNYSVRGGSFDENLVYVNDIEIYRPFLVRAGQQEGLSFINPDLVSEISFSAGGFSAMYGDKMSSVLDIKYRIPKKFGGSAYASLLGAGLHLEGSSKNEKFTWLGGLRHRSNQFLLKKLDTQGEYRPKFTDVQTLLNYKLGAKTEISFLGHYSMNQFRVIPSSRETEFGSINEALRFTVYFDGQEIDDFRTSTGALSLTHHINDSLKLKFITSAFYSREKEFFDVLGQYFLDELERDLGSDEFGDVAFNRGVGAFLDHARNELEAFVSTAAHVGSYRVRRHQWQWGLKAQREVIDDQLDEWQYRDSADYSVPHPNDQPGQNGNPNQQIVLNGVVKNKISLSSSRFSAYLQNTWNYDHFTFTLGLRSTYWDLNKEMNISPRAGLSFRPSWSKRLSFRAAGGIYYQPPFYRELRNLEGQINKNLEAQQSIHFVLGSDYQFLAWGREFKLSSEVYYKRMNNLIPYKLDNTRIRYLAKNNASGYATGLDLRVNGEFVSGIESWVSLGILKTEEDIRGDGYYRYFNSDGEEIIPGYTFNSVATDSLRVNPGSIPRPTDQRITFSMFFQDYLPKFPTVRMHLNLVFGTGLPFGPPGNDRYKDILRAPSYRRVDIGFSKIAIDEDGENKSRLPVVKNLKSLIFSLEVFNLLQVSNTISYTWITDVSGRQYGIPNYLTSRLLNFKMQAKF
ncbi:MAG: TonB-dependent receptor [Bacteroidia bacterium]|nr:TonB-dependent receptor [Bacteroidia bacterium]